jgi:TATA-box binding protein (TBP) (component of TFIID and TFIIIB)
MNLSVSNIKGAFKILHCENTLKELKKIPTEYTKFYSNCVVLRHKFVYIIYWTSNYVNVTKIPSKEDLSKCVSHFEEITKLECEKSVRIHNIVAHGNFNARQELEDLSRRLHLVKSSHIILLNRSFFPSLFIKKLDFGTCIIYQTGKFCLIGVKDFEKLDSFFESICVIMMMATNVKL